VIRDLFEHMGLSGAGRRAGFILAFAVVLIYGLMAVRGPQGIQALLDKHREIRQLEEQNAAIARENQRRKERIQRLQTSTSEQEMEIRKQLKLLRPGETTFILPDAPKENAAPAEAPAQP
jgi:cell division protein FtsB